MPILPPDPFADGGVVGFAARLRAGATTAAAATAACLERIRLLDPRLVAFEHVADDDARATARALDAMLGAGIDLGPLMGMPVAVKDLLAVAGMPTSAGSNLDVADLIGDEGPFIRMLRRAGCVIVGKTKTPEFALGGGWGGVSFNRGTPRNPWDAERHLIPGGSSSGSAVAVAAGLCGFAIGTDTSGSVRAPAALCGVVGHKTTVGRWPTGGMFQLSPTLDTIGILARCAGDAALIDAALRGEASVAPRPPRGLRLGRPVNQWFDDLDPPVRAACETAIAGLAAAGVAIDPVRVPEFAETETIFRELVPAELIAYLGRERFAAGLGVIDPIVQARAEPGLATLADRYLGLLGRYRALCRAADERLAGLDGWIGPTVPVVATPVPSRAAVEHGPKPAVSMVRNTQAASLMGLCAISVPVQSPGGGLPVGLQIVARAGADRQLIAIARLVETVVGPPPLPDMTRFVA